MRTYTLYVGKMAEAVAVYREFPWYDKFADRLVGYFQSDVGSLNQLVHLWKFEDDTDRRHHWQAVYADPVFTEFRSEEHTSELQSLMRISYAVFCLQKKKNRVKQRQQYQQQEPCKKRYR